MRRLTLSLALERILLAGLLGVLTMGRASAIQTVVNFDSVTGADILNEATHLTTAFSAQGVTFAGPGGNDGMAVLKASSFPGGGVSAPNLLAWYIGQQLADGGASTGPETITFNNVTNSVQINAASGAGLGVGQTVKMEAYNSGNVLLASSEVILGPDMAPLSVRAAQIKKVVISSAAALLVLDDLVLDNAPLNDVCIDATLITPGSYSGDTGLGYSDGSGCGNSGDSPDLWFAYYATASGPITLNTTGIGDGAGTNFDTILSVYSGCPGNSGTLLACNDDAPYTPNTGATSQSEINMNVTMGQTYYIRVAGFGGGKGHFLLNLTDPAHPQPALGSGCGWQAQFPSADTTFSGPGTPRRFNSTEIGPFTAVEGAQAFEETLYGDRPWVTGLRLDLFLSQNVLATGDPLQIDWRVSINGVQVGTFSVLNTDPEGLLTLPFGPFAPIEGPNYTIRVETINIIPPGNGAIRFGYSGAVQSYATLTSDPSFTLDASARGNWDSDGFHEASNNSTFTGYSGGDGVTRNSYFSFPIIRSLHAADYRLRLEVAGYLGPDASETFTVNQVINQPETVEADGTTSIGIFNDLQDGTTFAEFTVTAADVGKILEIPLLDINTTGNAFAGTSDVVTFGVHCTSAVGAVTTQGASFSSASETRTHQLILDYCPYDGRALGDFDNNGCTEIGDFLYLLDYWSMVSPLGGEAIGIGDFLALLDNWNLGPSCP